MQCVFHSIRFKVNKGWSKALLLFYAYTPNCLCFPLLGTSVNHPLITAIGASSTNGFTKSRSFAITCAISL
ncbi:hypothetical protein GA574_14135 [Bacteroides xylanisolvens]|uniref:Uncharacterized protein n=1 Tax=Bacteroides xylanisolvens TaxID=371601 RepID=A0A7J5P175_9BACE|nr:hypothetical protein GA574_14135 [Bacteroides xylanisolvens]